MAASANTKDMLSLVQKQLAALRSEILLSKSVPELVAKVKISNILLRQFENVHKSLRAEYRTWDKLAGSDRSWISTRLNGGMGSSAVPENVIQKYVSMQQGKSRDTESAQHDPEYRSMYWSSKPAEAQRSSSSLRRRQSSSPSAENNEDAARDAAEVEKYFREKDRQQKKRVRDRLKAAVKQVGRSRSSTNGLWARTQKAPIRLGWRNV